MFLGQLVGLVDPLELLKALNAVSPLGVVALLAYIIYMLVNNKRASKLVGENVVSVKDNHLSDLPEMLNLMRSMTETLRRQEENQRVMNDNLIYIRARTNGKL